MPEGVGSKKFPYLIIAAIIVVLAAAAIIFAYKGGLKEKDEGNYSLPATPAQSTGASYTAAEVSKHSTAASCYVIVGDSVYDLSAWIAQHPGGQDAILGLCGTDGSAAFAQQHGSNREAQAALVSFKIGALK